jgi:glycosyltransferase involved in cell wall biosynthesis
LTGWRRGAARQADRLIVALNTRCYADSESQRAYMETQGVSPPSAVRVLGAGSLAGVDLAAFDPARCASAGAEVRRALGIQAQDMVIVFVGRVTRDKGVGELVAAMGSLETRFPGLHLILVGPEEPERDPLPAKVREAITSRGRIHAVGYRPDPASYLAAADLLCLPSYREGFGNVVIEAGAMGLPAVGTQIPGLRDAIVEGITGLLVPAKDAAALERALALLLEDDTRRRKMGEAARVRARRDFDAATVNANVLDEYQRLLGARAG